MFRQIPTRCLVLSVFGCVPSPGETTQGGASATESTGSTSTAETGSMSVGTGTTTSATAGSESESQGESDASTGGPPAAACPGAVVAPELVIDLAPISSAAPQRIFVQGCAAYFNAKIGDDLTLWRTDGSESGTYQVTPEPRYFGQPLGLGDLVVFWSDDQPWRTDGTAAGTRALMEGWALPGFFTERAVVDDVVYYTARDVVSRGVFVESEHGVEPWRSDGSVDGTTLVVDTEPGSAPEVGGAFGYTPRGDEVFFWAGAWPGTMWRSDGSSEGSVAVIDVGLSRAPIQGAPPSQGAALLGDRLIFLGSQAGAFGIWASDGTAPGTELLAILDEPTAGGTSMYNQGDRFRWAEMGGHLYLFASPQGTPLPNTEPDAGGNAIGEGILYFGPPVDSLWVTDGTAAGTERIVELATEDYSDTHLPAQLVAVGERLHFYALDEEGMTPKPALYVSDGTGPGTEILQPYDAVEMMVALGDAVAYPASTAATGFEVYVSRGTAATTELLADIRPGPEGAISYGLQVIGERLVFAADDGTHGREPWVSDGTAEGTVLAGDINPGSDGSAADEFVALGDVILFSALETSTGRELWKM